VGSSPKAQSGHHCILIYTPKACTQSTIHRHIYHAGAQPMV
jgi:hypothetical protein